MRESYFYQLALTKKLRQLLVLVFLLSAHIGAWAEDYNLWIGGVRVTDLNKDAITGDSIIGGSASFTPGTSTLTLSGVTIYNGITSGLDNLTIVITGTNKLNTEARLHPIAIKSDNESAVLSFEKNGDASLELKASSGNSIISGFASVNYSSGTSQTYLSSSNPAKYDTTSKILLNPIVSTNVEPITSATITSVETYPLWVAGNQVTSENADDILDDSETHDGASISFNGETTLILNEANLGGNIISDLDNVIIKLSAKEESEERRSDLGEYRIISINSSATLTFTTDDNSRLCSTIGNYGYPWEGFADSPTFLNKLVLIQHAEAEFIQVLSAPTIERIVEGSLTFSNLSYENSQFDCYYSIDYEEGQGTDVAETKCVYESEDEIQNTYSISLEAAPCTVSAYVTYKDAFNNTTTSATAIAKYYGFAEPMRVVFNGTPSELTNLPALIPGGDDVTYKISGSSDENVISFLEETGKYTIKGYGRVYLTAAIPEDVLPLNDGCEATLTVNVVPDAPTFKIGDNAITGNVTYDEAQTLTIVPDVLGDNITIKYYEGTDETSTTTYEEEINIDETKTINAWVEYYDATNKTTLYGDTASVTITIRRDPGLAYKLGEVQATTVTATIGETFTQPTLENPNSLDITYTSSVPGVATIAADGTITLVGIGTTVIKAESAQTETLLAGSAEYTLNVLKQLSHETITITVGAATYTGEAVTPTVTVKDGETEISSDLYDIEYSNNTAAATAEDTDAPTVTIIAKENLQDAMNYYTGQATKKFTIAGRSISDFTISLSVETFEYNGSAQTPTVTFTEEGQTKEMTENTDYTLTYANNTNAGSASAETAPQVTITGTGNYTGEVVKKFSITAKDLEGATISDIEDQTFTGSQIKPEPTVTIVLIAGAEATTLVTGTDFDYSYSNNTDAATSQNVYAPTVTITGKGNYSGTKTAKFNIAKADPTITKAPEAKTLTYTGEAQALIEAGTATGGNLTYSLEEEGTYSTDIPTGTDRGNYTVYYKVEGDINHNNTSAQSLAVTIAAKALSNDMIQAIDNQTYTGEAIEPVITVKDGETTLTGDDYAVSYANNTNASTEASVTITAKEDGNYSGTATRTFTIEAKNISGVYAIALDTQDYIYTGSEIKPAITVNNQEGNSLTSETDYTVAYSNNINLGTTEGGDNAPTITVTGKGNYSGTITAKFNIRPKSIADESITIEPIADQAYTGEAITPTITVKDGEKTLTKDTDYTVSYNGDNTSVTPEGSETLPTVIITGAGNYDSTTTKSVTFKIVAATATITVTETTQEVTYNGQPQAITGVSVTKGTTKVTYYTSEADRSKGSNALGETPTDAGTYYVQVTQDDANYASTPVDVTFTIKKAAITEVTLENNSLTFTGEEQSVTIASVKAGTLELSADDYTVSGEKATVIGTNTVTVTAKDESNYSGSASADYSIVAKNLTDAMVSLTITTYDYDGTAKKPAVTVKDGEQVLTLNTDFTVAYTDSINAGTATATIFGTGNYGGTVTKTYTINQVSLEGVTIETIADQAFTGSAVEPTVTVTFNGFTVSSDDYTVSYSNNINAGEATVTLTSTNRNFTEGSTKTATFTINNRAIDAATKESLFEGGKEYASYYSATEDLSLGEGIAAYIITGVSGNSVITTPLSYIPKGVPVLLESINGTSTETGTATDGNMLRYATTATTIPSSDGTAYVLYNNMYVRVTNNAIPAGKSYLLVPATVNIGGSARQLAISHGGDAAGIDAIEWNDGDKEVWFDLQGRRIDRPTKAGLYIKNGQKTVVK